MKKRKQGRSLSRVRSQRIALLRTMTTSLIMHKKIKTTLAKAKELRPFAEKIATHAKKATDEKQRMNMIRLLKKDLHANTVGELIKMADKFKSRNGGYLRIVRLNPRKSDGSAMAMIEWVDVEKEAKKADKQSKESSKKEKKSKQAEKEQDKNKKVK